MSDSDGRISLNGLKRYADSNNAFALATTFGSKEKSIDIWKSKNDRQLAPTDETTVIGDTGSDAPPALKGGSISGPPESLLTSPIDNKKSPGSEALKLTGLVPNVVRQETSQKADPPRDSAPAPVRVRYRRKLEFD